MLGFYRNIKHFFCAIFVFCAALLFADVAHAVCDVSSVDNYRSISSYYCSAAGADPTVSSLPSFETCVRCKDGYVPSVAGEFTDYECGSGACTGVGEPDSSKCVVKKAIRYGCSLAGGSTVSVPRMRIDYVCNNDGSGSVLVGLSVVCEANDNCYLGCADHTRPCEPEHVCSKTGHVLTGWLLSDNMGAQFQGVYPPFENLTGAQYAYGEEASFSVSADARWEQATCTATNGTCGPVSVDEYNMPYATITCNTGYSKDGGTNTITSFVQNGSAGVASMTATCKARSITVKPGYYLPKGSMTAAECPKTTTVSGSTVGAYCTGGTFLYSETADQGITACPAFNSTTRVTSYPSVTGFSLSYSSGQAIGWYTGQSSISQCLARYTLTNEAGTVEWGGVKYNTSTGKYDVSRFTNVADGFLYKKLNPGYYFTERYSSTYCNTTTNPMYYKTAAKCTAGYYCPGYTSMPLCSSGTYNTEMGRFICTGATYSAAGASKCTSCPGDYTYSTSNGKTSVSSCQIQCPAGTMIAERYGNCTSPSGGWWAPGARVASYGNFVPVDYCMAGYTSSGTTASAHDAMSDCTKDVSNASVSSTIPARYIRLKSAGNTVNSYGTHVVEIQAFASLDATGTNLLSGKSATTGTNPTYATDGSTAQNLYSSTTANNYITWDMGAIKNIGSLKFAMYSADNRTYNNVQIDVSTNGLTWTTVFGPRNVSSPKADATNSKLEYVKLAGQTACATGYSSPSTTVSLGSTKSCSISTYTVTLDSKYYATSSTSTGTAVTTNAVPTSIYVKYNTGYYTNSGATTEFTELTTMPVYTGYKFGGFWTEKTGTGIQVIDSYGKLNSGKTTAFLANGTLYAKWTPICNKITLNNTTNGGTGGTTAVYKKTGSTTYYSDSACTTGNEITKITLPSKTNAIYAGTTNDCITTNGYLSTSTKCNVSTAATWVSQYSCKPGYQYGLTNYVTSGECPANQIEFVFLDAKDGNILTYVIITKDSTDADANAIIDNYYKRPGYSFGGFYFDCPEYYDVFCDGENSDWYLFAGQDHYQKYTDTSSPFDFNAAVAATVVFLYPKYTPNKITVDYNEDGGSAVSNGSCTYGGSLTLPTPSAKTGYTFVGWKLNDGTVKNAGSSATCDYTNLGVYSGTSSAVTAQWTPNEYTITLDNDGATESGTTILYTRYGDGVYLDAARTQKLTTYSQIVKPQKKYIVDYQFNYDYAYAPDTATYNFIGYYFDNSMLAILPNGRLSQDGIEAAINSNADMTWRAMWNDSNAKLTLPTPKRNGYTFAGWTTAATGGILIGGAGASYTPTANITLYAQWTPNEYTITLDNNGATESGATTLYTRYGDGVYLDAARTKKMTTDNHSIEIPKKYWTITYDANGGSAEKTYDRITVPFTSYSLSRTAAYSTSYINTNGFITADGLSAAQAITENTTWYAKWNTNLAAMTSITLPRARRTGYTLYSWYTDIDGTQKVVGKAGDSYTTTGGDVTLYAHWNAVKYTITYEENGGSDIDDKTYYITSKTFSLPTPIRDGYTFGGWYSNADLSGESVTEIPTGSTGDKTFWAKWTGNTYTVTLDPNVGDKQGLADGYTTSVTATYGQPMPSATMPHFQVGYNFDGYYTSKTGGTQYYDADGNSVRNWDIAQNSTLFAQWSVHSGKLAFDANGGTGTLPTSPTTCTYESCVIPSSNLTKTGYTFAGWYFYHEDAGQVIMQPGEDAGVYFADVTMNGKTLTLTALWDACTYSVKYNANGGSGTMSNSSHTYDTAKALTANAFTRAGCKFTGWATSTNGSVVHADKASVKNLTSTCGGTVNMYAVWSCGTITAKDVTLTYNGTTTSNGTAQSCANVIVSNMTGATVKYKTGSATTYTTTEPTLTNVGTLTVNYEVSASGYTSKTGSYTCTMNAKAMDVPIPSNKTLTYTDGSALSCANVTVKVPTSGASVTYSEGTSTTYTTTAPTLTHPGSKTINYKVTGSNFTPATGSYTCTMDKATGATVIKDGSTVVTNKSGSTEFPGPKSLSVTCSGGATATITNSAADVATASISSNKISLSPKATGSAVITVDCPATTDYTASSATYTWNVTDGTISVEKDNVTGTYGETLTCSGLTVSSPSGTKIEYSTDGGSTWSTTVPSRTTAGTTTVNYRVSKTYYTPVTGSYTCTMNKAENPITLSATTGTMAYSTTATFAVKDAQGTLSVKSSNENAATAEISGTTVTVTSKASYGTATITVTAAGNSNYNSGSKTYSVTVNKGTITLDNQGATTAGTTKIYQTYNTNVYLDSARSKAMTTSANKITIPAKTGYTFDGYYDSTSYTTQYVGANGFITSAGLTAGKALKANGTWYAKWEIVTCSATNGTCGTVTVTDNVPSVTITCNTGYSKSGGANTTSSFTVTGSVGATSLNGSCSEKCNKITINPYCTGSTYNPPLYKKTNTTGWYSDSACKDKITQITDLPQSCNNSNGNYTLRGVYSAKVTSLTADGKTGTQYFTKSGNATTTGINLKVTGTKTLYLAWTKDCNSVFNGTCDLDVADNGTVDYTTSCDTGYTLDGSDTYAPICNAKEYTVTYSCGSGTGTVPSSATATYDSDFIPATNDTSNCKRDGYTFSGWTTTDDSGTTVPHAAGTAFKWQYTADKTFTAKWTGNKITVNYNENGGDAVSNGSCTYGGSLKLPSAATKDGSVFAGWKLKDGTVKNAGDSVTCNYTNLGVYSGTSTAVTAQWTVCAAGNYCPGDNTSKACPDNSNSASGASNCTCNTGYNYNGGNSTTTAACVANTYSVKYNANGGSGTMSNSSHTYNTAKALTANTFTRTGYTFAGWNTKSDGTGTGYADKAEVTNLTSTNGTTVNLYARWTACTYSVKYNANGGSGTMSNSSHTYDTAEALTANTFTRTGYTFAGWNTKSDGTGTNYADKASVNNLTSTCGGTVNLYAKWTIKSVTCSAGYYLGKGALSCTQCECGHYCPGGTFNYNASSVQGRTACDAGTYNSDTGASAASACKTTSAGYYAVAGSCNQTKIKAKCYGGAGSKVECPNSCPSPYSNSVAGSDAVNDCYLTTTAGNYVAETGKGQVTCAAGGYCLGGTTVYHSSGVGDTTGGRDVCACGTYNADTGSSVATACVKTTGGYYSGAGATSQTKATAGYYAAAGACKQTACSGRTKYSAAGAASCKTVSSGYYTTGCNSSGNICTGQNQCVSGTYCESGVQKTCPSDATRTVASANGSVAATSCYVTCGAMDIDNGETTIDNTVIYSENSKYAACTYSASCNDGYEVSGNGTTAPACTACAIGSYGGGNTVACSVCPNGGTTASVATTAITSCYKTGLPYEATRGDGTQRCFYTSGDGDSAEYSTDCDSIQITSCDAKYYLKTDTATNCTSVGTGYYSAAGVLTRTRCPTNYRSGGAASSQSGCKTKCADGAYVATAKAACVNVGSGYYAATHTVAYGKTSSVRGQCAAGLTTIGYGAGANEAGDCGRILNIDGEKLYLRSTKKTEHALYVRVGEDVFYGNMDTASKVISEGATNKLRIRYNDTVYYVHDDSVN